MFSPTVLLVVGLTTVCSSLLTDRVHPDSLQLYLNGKPESLMNLPRRPTVGSSMNGPKLSEHLPHHLNFRQLYAHPYQFHRSLAYDPQLPEQLRGDFDEEPEFLMNLPYRNPNYGDLDIRNLHVRNLHVRNLNVRNLNVRNFHHHTSPPHPSTHHPSTHHPSTHHPSTHHHSTHHPSTHHSPTHHTSTHHPKLAEQLREAFDGLIANKNDDRLTHPHHNPALLPQLSEKFREVVDSLLDSNKNRPHQPYLPEVEGEFAYQGRKGRRIVNTEEARVDRPSRNIRIKLMNDQELNENEIHELSNGRSVENRYLDNNSPIADEVIKVVLENYPNLINLKKLSIRSFGLKYVYEKFVVRVVLGECNIFGKCKPELVEKAHVYELKAHKTMFFPIKSDGLKDIDQYHSIHRQSNVRIPLTSHRRYPSGLRPVV